MPSTQDAINLVRKLHEEKYPEAITIFLSGSMARNEFMLKSDLDLIIIFPKLPNAYREAFIYENWMIDAFVHDEATLNYFFNEVDKTTLSPGLANMIYEGIEIPCQTPLGIKLKQQATKMIQAKPTLNSQELTNRRFQLTDLLDDLQAPRTTDERLAILQELYKQLGEFYLLANNQWLGTAKNLIRAIQKHNSKIAQEFTHAFSEAFTHAHQPKLEKLILDTLNPHGGRLWEGYHSDASEKFRLEPTSTFGELIDKKQKIYSIKLDEAENSPASQAILAGVRAYNIQHLGLYHRQHFALYLQDEEGKTIAGLSGEYLETLCSVHLAWIEEKLRGLNIGTQLFIALEKYIKNKRCTLIQLDTTDFQARPFYEKLGYTVVATLPKGFKGHVQWVMRKNI